MSSAAPAPFSAASQAHEEEFAVFSHQVGGHGKILTSPDGLLYKPAQQRELQFYLDLRTKNTDLLPFCARLRGVAWLQEKGRRPGAKEGLEVVTFAVQLLDVEENSEEVCVLCESLSPYLRENTGVFIVLEDLTRAVKSPCVMDLKVGTRIHGLDAPAEKAQRLSERMKVTTSGSMGLAMSGFKCVKHTEDSGIVHHKMTSAQGKDLVEDTMRSTIQEFFHDGVRYRAPVVASILEQLDAFHAAISTYTPQRFRFWATSLLLIYDADPAASVDPLLRLVDFASTFPVEALQEAGLDPDAPAEQDGFVFGLDHLRDIVRDLHHSLAPAAGPAS